jgi:glycosyltransferase involved in cell wall biosynthesis
MNVGTITVVLPTYNSERFMAECLESVSWAENIIVVDGFSSDGTVDIARRYTDKIFQDKRGYSARVNLGIDQARSEWILQLNSNERITAALRDEILQVTRADSDFVGYRIPRANDFWGTPFIERPGPLYLYRKGSVRYTTIGRHEMLPLVGKIGQLKNWKIHRAASSIEEAINKWNLVTSEDAQSVFNGGTRAFLWNKPVRRTNIFNMTYRPLAGFFSGFFLSGGFRRGRRGFVLAVLVGFYYFMEIAKLWELEYKSGEK